MNASTWRVDVQFGEETYVAQGHLDPLDDLFGYQAPANAEVEIQALISGPFSNSRIVSTVRLTCSQATTAINLAQEKATAIAMEGLRNGWEALQERVAKGHFPGCAEEQKR